MALCTAVFLLFALFSIPDPTSARHRQKAFFLVTSKHAGYNHLQSLCQTNGGVLANIENAHDHQEVKKILRMTTKEPYVMVGGTRSHRNPRQFVYSDGRKLTYAAWGRGEPNNLSEKCIMLYVNHNGQYNDIHCNRLNTGICQKEGQKRFFFVTSRARGIHAMQSLCRQRGGVVAKIENAADHRLAQQVLRTIKHLPYVYIDGGRSPRNPRQFIFTDGRKLSYTAWAPGEPNYLSEKCVMLYVRGRLFGKYNDIACHSLNGAICQSTVRHGKVSPDKFFMVNSGNNGYGHLQSLCKKNGGFLAQIKNAHDHLEVKKVLRRTTKEHYVWIDGMRSRHNPRQFVYSDGRKLSYAAWARGQPDLLHEKCVMLYVQGGNFGKYNDLTCNQLNTAICQRGAGVVKRRKFRGLCTCSASGDPHYSTFDGTRLNFQSVCRYVMATSHAKRGCAFSVEAQNWVRGGNRRVSYLHYVVVKMFGQEFRMMRGKRMRVNGRYVRHYNNGKVQLRVRHNRMEFNAENCGLRVFYDGNVVAIINLDRSVYGKRVSGVCGNCDGNRRNDWRTRQGKQIPPKGGNLYNAEVIGRSWAVRSDDGRVCGRWVPKPEPACPKQTMKMATEKCGVLMKHHIIFKACIDKKILSNNFKHQYDECVIDVCALGRSSHLMKRVTCGAAKVLADRCRAGGVKVNWRGHYNCPRPTPPPKKKSVCEYSPERGPCRGSHTRFFFNKNTGTCRPFVYGGCGGNPNRFESYTDCLTECGGIVKPKPTDCASNEVSVILLQRLRVMIEQIMAPKHHLENILSFFTSMQRATAQFKVIMKLFIQMRQMKTQHDMFTKYVNMRQIIGQLFGIIKHGINKRYDFSDNILIKQNTHLIKQVVSGFKIIKQVYTGRQKTNVFVQTFDKVHKHESSQVFGVVSKIMNKGVFDRTHMDAIRVMMPTLMMTDMEAMSQCGFKSDTTQLTHITDQFMRRIQTLNTVVQHKVVKHKRHIIIAR